MSGNERRNRKVFRWCWNDCRVDALTMYSGSEFQMEEAAAGKARLPTVESLTDGTMRRLVAAERTVRWPGTSATRVSVCTSICVTKISGQGWGHHQPCTFFPSCRLIAMWNLVAVFHTVWTYVGRSQNIWGRCGPAPWNRDLTWPFRNTFLPTWYHAEFDHYRSNGTSVRMEICLKKIDPSHPAF